MIIIMEGTDRCGKSTQIKKLMQYLVSDGKPIQILHYTSIKGLSPEDQTEFFKKTFNQMFNLVTDNIMTNWILDRSHLGETVYAPLYRPTQNCDWIWKLEKSKLQNIPENSIFLFTFIDSSLDYLKRDDGDSYTVDPEIAKKEISLFKEATNKTSIKHAKLIDIAGKSIDEVHQELISFIESSL